MEEQQQLVLEVGVLRVAAKQLNDKLDKYHEHPLFQGTEATCLTIDIAVKGYYFGLKLYWEVPLYFQNCTHVRNYQFINVVYMICALRSLRNVYQRFCSLFEELVEAYLCGWFWLVNTS